MKNRRTPVLFLFTLLATFFVALLSSHTAKAETQSATVVYVDGAQQVYLDQGAEAGLNATMILDLKRRGTMIARVEIIRVSSERATAKILDANSRVKAGDTLTFDGASAVVSPPPKRQRQARIELEQPLKPSWRDAILAKKRPLLAHGSEVGPVSPRLRVRGDMEWVSRAYSASPQLQRNEQRIGLWSQGKDIGVTGLNLRIRGDVKLRYGSNAYRFQNNTHAVQSFREVAFTYTTPGSLRFSAGRFKPQARLAGTLDGVQASWGTENLSFSVFGGLRPELTTLNPSLTGPTFGTQVQITNNLTADNTWRLSLAYLGEAGDSFQQSLSVDSSIKNDKARLWQQATFHRPTAEHPGGVSLFTLQGLVGEKNGIHLNASARYINQPILSKDTVPQTDGWIEPLKDRALARSDVGVTLPRGDNTAWRPYLYWDQQHLSGIDDTFIVAGGMAWKRKNLWVKNLALNVHGDYGDGTRQQARMGVSLSYPRGRFGTALGSTHQWTYSHSSDLHTFQHIAQATLTYQGQSPFNLWAAAQGAVDHDAYAKALGVWGSGRLGIHYEW